MNKLPADQKAFAVFYANRAMFRQSNLDLRADKSKKMTMAEFHEHYTYVGTYKAESADAVFSLLQDGGGGLGADPVKPASSAADSNAARMMQELLIRKIGHTSMSTSDVIVDLAQGEVMVCASFGWDRIEVLGLNSLAAVA